MEIPLLSICLITYNHAKYIREAIEGVLMQKVNFTWELIIADDFSTDGTKEILLEYKQKHPDFIKLILQSKNVGAAQNWTDLISSPNSKYIAYFEGDDYWTDPLKLKKQIDFLEANPEYVGTYHNTEERYQDSEEKGTFLYCNGDAKAITFEDLSFQNLMPTCSVVYRNNLFKQLPKWYSSLPIGDWPLHLMNAQFGNFWYIPKVMGVHRLHTESTWALQSHERNIKSVITTYDMLIKGFADRKELSQLLVNGKASFIKSHKISLWQSFKNKVSKAYKRE